MPKKATSRRGRHRLGLVLGFLGLTALGVLGGRWMAALHVEYVDVTGAVRANRDALLELAQVDTGLVMLDVDPALVADRVQRHPWVETVRVTRLPTGTLAFRVRERTPVALVLDTQGQPVYYLDRDGYAMPAAPGDAFDVPLLRGVREAYHPVRPVQTPAVRALLTMLAAAGVEAGALISELELRGDDLWVRTQPAGDRGALIVAFGRGDLTRKLATLHAFWHQAVLPRPDRAFHLIDLRFDSQVITREE